MKLLHVTPAYLPAWRYGGPIRSIHGLCKALAALGHEVDVFTTNVDGPFDSNVPLETPVQFDGVTVWYFPSRHLRRLNWSPTLGDALARRCGDFQLVHIHSLFLWPPLAAARAARRAGVPYVVSPRGMLVRDLVRRKSRLLKTIWITLFDRRSLRRAAAIHMTSSVEAEQARRYGFTLPTTFIVPNGIDVGSQVVDGSAPAGEASHVLFLGRISWEKGLDRLIPALRHAPRARLVVAGNDDGNYRPSLERLAAEAGVLERVRFVGPVDGPRKARLLAEAALLVLPSYSENFGNVVLEAIAAGRAVLVTPEVGAADVVRATGAGRVVDGDPAALGSALQEMLADPEGLWRMGRSGRRILEQRFSWEAVGRDMARHYAELIPNPVGAAEAQSKEHPA